MGTTADLGLGADGLLTAFGETRTVAEWAADGRARAWAGLILERLAEGMSPEQAIGRPVEARRRDDSFVSPFRTGRTREKVFAFGQFKSLREWADDPRAGATREAIRKRLLAGDAPEEAITRPAMEQREDGLTAFGETKTMCEWSMDPRCSVTSACISQRLGRGMSPEEAICLPNRLGARLVEAAGEAVPEGAPKGRPGHARFLSAFGETKSVHGWWKDPRCAVDMTTLRSRVLEGWEHEAAIATPSATHPHLETAFGETKRLSEWAVDPRCAVTGNCLRQRVRNGMAMEAALTTPADRDWMGETFEAFGEAKTLREWSEDARCRVSYDRLQQRLSTYGMAFELAVASPPAICRKGRYGEVAEAFGETKLLGEWMRDPRCRVCRKTLGLRLREGWALERALTVNEHDEPAVNVQGRFVEAFGERKNLRQWSLDARCAVDASRLQQRLERGWDAERAIAEPPLPTDHLRGKRAPKRNGRVATAFGETKPLVLWEDDPRCRVAYDTLLARLDRGWDAERAIGTPSGTADADAPVRATRGGIAAFGETKPLAAWAKDRRCAVPAAVVQARLDLGWGVEDALTLAMGVAVARAA